MHNALKRYSMFNNKLRLHGPSALAECCFQCVLACPNLIPLPDQLIVSRPVRRGLIHQATAVWLFATINAQSFLLLHRQQPCHGFRSPLCGHRKGISQRRIPWQGHHIIQPNHDQPVHIIRQGGQSPLRLELSTRPLKSKWPCHDRRDVTALRFGDFRYDRTGSAASTGSPTIMMRYR